MADLVMGAMGSLIPKLGELLKEEHNLQTSAKERVRSLTLELEGTQAALRKVAQVPWDELDEQVKLWAWEVRESSYDMEDVLDTFLVSVQGRDSSKEDSLLKRLKEKMTNLFKKSKARRKISVGVKDIMSHLDEVMERCRRYKVDDIVATPAIASTIDPRLAAMYNKAKNLVGVDNSSDELISMLQTLQRGDMPNARLKIVAVVGVGGLGKTTLAKVVYDKLKEDFDRRAFVPVGRNPDLKKVFKDILIDLDRQRYLQFNTAELNERHLIDELRNFFLESQKRFFIVIDDMWEVQSWETIKLAFDDDGNCGGRIIVTTRKLEVATKAGEVYRLRPLSYDSSRELFCTRMLGDQGSHVDNQPDEISDKILKKCGGIPLAIITMASLLVGKPKGKWIEICKNISFGRKDSKEIENTTTKILSFSYYDLPSHLRTCLLYLCAFPEDSVVPKIPLIWKWVAEGFVQEEQGSRLFEIGEGYFNDLINRSWIQAVESNYFGIVSGCRVHDIVLDFIRSMSSQENFFTILDNNDQGRPSHNHVRRLGHHNKTMRHTQQVNHFDSIRKVRSFSAQGCAIESWVPLSSFTVLRVLAIENCNLTDGCRRIIEHVGHLVHLRYLSLRGTLIHRIPEEIGALRFLQTVDLLECKVVEMPSSSSLPTQLACLHITFDFRTCGDMVPWVERLTCLEELSINRGFRWKELGSLRELRVLNATSIFMVDDEEDFAESMSNLDKLQHVAIKGVFGEYIGEAAAAGLVLSRQLQHLVVAGVTFTRLPQCINSSCLPNLSHLWLAVQEVDEQGLKNIGGLPELHSLQLGLWGCSSKISNISDSDVVYFPKLRPEVFRDEQASDPTPW